MTIKINNLETFLAHEDAFSEIDVPNFEKSADIKCVDCGYEMEKISYKGYFVDIPRHANKYYCDNCHEEKIL